MEPAEIITAIELGSYAVADLQSIIASATKQITLKQLQADDATMDADLKTAQQDISGNATD